METKREQITTEVVFNGDRTYEIKRRIEGYKGDKAILIGLYPTIDGDNITKIDSTQLHLINHMKESQQYHSLHMIQKILSTFQKLSMKQIRIPAS